MPSAIYYPVVDVDLDTLDTLTYLGRERRRPRCQPLQLLAEAGVSDNARIMYRAQPYIEGPRQAIDQSFEHFLCDARDSNLLPSSLERRLKDVKCHLQFACADFLTYLDLMAAIPKEVLHRRHDAVAVNMLLKQVGIVLQEGYFQWDNSPEIDINVRNLQKYVFCCRLIFYLGRQAKHSMEEIRGNITSFGRGLRLPHIPWMDNTELESPQFVVVSRFIVEGYVRWITFKEWLQSKQSKPTRLEDITTPISQGEIAAKKIECPICREAMDATAGVRTNACKHDFCAECLEIWIGSRIRSSNACPNCRTVLFSRSAPPRNQSSPEDRLETARWRRAQHSILLMKKSWEWLLEEMELQDQIEAETRPQGD